MKRTALWLLALTLVGCGQGGSTSAPDAGKTVEPKSSGIELSKDAEKTAGIETEKARVQDVQSGLDVPGTVTSTSKGRAVVTPTVAGRVVSINVQLGAKVVQGQTLAVIESTDLAQSWTSVAEAKRVRDAAISEVAQTVSEAELAGAKLASAKTTLARQRDLAKTGAFSQAPLQQAKAELNDAQSDLISVQQELTTHSDLLRRTESLFKDGLVAKADLDLARLEVQQDQVRLAREKSRVESAKIAYERESTISQRGLLNAKEVQTAEADVRSATIELQTAQLKVRSARAARDNADKAVSIALAAYRTASGNGSATGGRVALVAPISGTLTHLDLTQGQTVERTQALFQVENLDAVWVTANVPEKDAALIHANAQVMVTLAALPGREFKGIVQVVGTHIDPKTRSVPVQCLIEAAGGALVPDMFASVHIGVGATKPLPTVPKTAVVTEDRRSFVFVRSSGKFEKREVETGASKGGSISILKGIKEGDEIAVRGAFVLQSESKKDELKGDD
ncbi:MAG: efflux RND transporter periplasmic adaptor subunit [Nitrospira sp.]|nr:efflux RND transporter periplasmic adaptor subunit [Nitrospira sp.]